MIENKVILTGDEILDETLAWLQGHFIPRWGDREYFDPFNRLLAKAIRAPGWKDGDHMDVTPDQITSRRETRTTSELGNFTRGHERRKPARQECPIIVAEYQGVEYLLDGNNRINLWIDQEDTREHPVNVHVIRY